MNTRFFIFAININLQRTRIFIKNQKLRVLIYSENKNKFNERI